MTLHAKIHTTPTGDITVLMEGGLDFETSIPFREEVQSLMENNPCSTVTLDMNRVDFVGSSGISIFVETLRILGRKQGQLKLSNVKEEFVKVFKLYKLETLENLIDQFESDETEETNTLFGGRRRTFEQ